MEDPFKRQSAAESLQCTYRTNEKSHSIVEGTYLRGGLKTAQLTRSTLLFLQGLTYPTGTSGGKSVKHASNCKIVWAPNRGYFSVRRLTTSVAIVPAIIIGAKHTADSRRSPRLNPLKILKERSGAMPARRCRRSSVRTGVAGRSKPLLGHVFLFSHALPEGFVKLCFTSMT